MNTTLQIGLALGIHCDVYAHALLGKRSFHLGFRLGKTTKYGQKFGISRLLFD